MRKLFQYPFLCLLVLTVLAAMPFAWQQIGLLPEERPQQEAVMSQPELRDPEPTPPAEQEPNVPAFNEIVEPVPEPVPPPAEPVQPEPDPEPAAPLPPENPFAGALFVGDSRTVGIYEYAGITDADFFASTGMSVYNVFKETPETDHREITLEELLVQRQYDRIYLMLGINELGYPFDMTVSKYTEVVAKLRELQPQAFLHIQANMHVTTARSDKDTLYNNHNINRLNEAIAALADGEQVFYLDVNPVFDDESGGLKDEYTGDDVHIYAKHYALWADWLRENTPA